jgi:hypothetical protein
VAEPADRPEAPVLLVTKLHPPLVPAQTVARDRLFEGSDDAMVLWSHVIAALGRACPAVAHAKLMPLSIQRSNVTQYNSSVVTDLKEFAGRTCSRQPPAGRPSPTTRRPVRVEHAVTPSTA